MQLFVLEMKVKSDIMLDVYQVPKSVSVYVQGVLTVPIEVVSLIIQI